MERDDAVILEELRDLLDDFCSGFNVSLSLLSRSGATLLTSPRNGPLAYCMKIQQRLGGSGPCVAQAQRMRHLASDRHDSIVYTCHAGLRCCACPFVSSGQVIAMATICGFRFGDKPSPAAIRDWQASAGSIDALLKDFAALPRFSAEMEKRMVRLFKVVTDHAVTRGLIGFPRSRLFEMIVDYVRAHIALTVIPINEVADHVRKSASTVSHVVKKEAGISFRRLVIEQKLRAAESLLSDDATRSIGDVAESLGFSDQFYFSRIYKKYRGFPPREFTRHRVG
jgi:AraC-like DNA-binding protein